MSFFDKDFEPNEEESSLMITPPSAPASLLQGLEFRIDLYKQYLSVPLSPEQLRQALQHKQWEVRCAAIERLGIQSTQPSVDLLINALSDENSYVREAASRILEHRRILLPKYPLYQEPEDHFCLSISTERKQASMSSLQQIPENITSLKKVSEHTHTRRKKMFHGLRLLALVSTLVIILGSLTAAGFGFGWWSPLFGNPNLYTTINQQQIHQGVTIKITQVYADEGRTIIAYMAFSKDLTKQYNLNNFDLVGSAPQKQEVQLATYGDSESHFYYMVQPPFLVPANVQALTLTLTIGNLIVVTTGEGSSTTITGPWRFVFTVPFHHENNTHISTPIHGNAGI